jgi:hypothetical protein
VNVFLFALLLPTLFWTNGPSRADSLMQAGVKSVSVPIADVAAWKAQAPDIQVQGLDPGSLIKLPTPQVNFRAAYASATREPWVDSNGWRLLRKPDGAFFYNAPGKSAALAAAEAYCYRTHAAIQTDEAGLKPFAEMIHFLDSLEKVDLPPLTNFDYVDDGSSASGEFMNLLIRSNLLFRVVRAPASGAGLVVSLGSPEFPKSEAGNPKLLAEKVRAKVTDAKRFLRVYGSSVVIGRLVGNGSQARLFLLNYGATRADVSGLRIRVLGAYSQHRGKQFGIAEPQLLDYTVTDGETEFTLPSLNVLAVIDLSKGR